MPLKAYKRKFLVPSDTPNPSRSYRAENKFTREVCEAKCPHFNRVPNMRGVIPHRPCNPANRYWEVDYQKCIYPEDVFDEYIVGETETGEYECSCRAWTTTFPRRDCKHIVKAKRDPKKYEVDPGFTGKSIQAIKKLVK